MQLHITPEPLPDHIAADQVVEVLPAATAVVTVDGRLQWANRAMRTLIGWTAPAPAPSVADLLVHPDVLGWVNELFHRVIRGETVDQPLHASLQRLDGSAFDAFLRLSRVSARDGTELVVVTLTPTPGPRHDLHPLRRALDLQEDLVCEFAPRGTVLYANRACREFFDFDRDPVGQRIDDLFDVQTESPGQGSIMRERVVDEIGLHHQSHTSAQPYPNGRTVEWTNTGVRAADGSLISILAVGRDVTDRIEAETALRHNEERFRTMALHIWDTILLIAPDGKVIDSTAPYRADLDHEPDFWTDVDLLDVLHPDDRNAALHALSRLVESGAHAQATTEVRAQRKGGEYTWVELNATNLIGQPSIDAILLSVRNIEERKQFEEELAARSAREHASLERRQSFVDQVSHELRNLVHGTLGLSEILGRSELPAESTEVVQALQRQATTLRRIVDDLIDEGHIEAGTLQVRSEVIDLDVLVRDVALLAQPHVGPDVVLFAAEVDPVLQRVVGDGDRLRQAVHNLLQNAIRHTTRGSIVVEVSPGSLPDTVRIAVRDTGAGIDPHDVDRLFRPYERGRTDRTHGVGLGLAIVKATVESMHGTVGADARPDGATFWVQLARSLTTDTTPTRGVARPSAESPDVGRLSVLVIDDDPINLLVASMQLGELHADVVTAASLADATEAISTRSFDVVFCDLNLHDGSAFDFLARVRARPGGQPFIAIMSGDANPERPRQLLAAGADHFLPKPATLRDLADVLALRHRIS